MSKPEDALMAKLSRLSPAQREALLNKLKQKKPEKSSKNKLLDSPIAVCDRSVGNFELSCAQQRLWFLEQLNPDSAAYNIAAAIELQGPLNRQVLEQSFQRIIQRHESLRTRFAETEQGIRQFIEERVDWHMAVHDLRDQTDRIAGHIHQDANQGFDLGSAPLIRVKLYLLGQDRAVLSIVMHHIISDAWSSQLLLAEVSRIYSALIRNTAIALPIPKIQYIDYAAWQKSYLQQAHSKQQLHYWQEKLQGFENLNLACDKARPAAMTQQGDYLRLQLEPGLTGQLQALCQSSNSTLFNGLLAAFECLLYRYTQQHDFCIGTPVAGRIHPDVEPLIGFFVNTLPLRCDIEPGDNFQSLLRKVKRTTLEAQSQQDIPFEQLVDQLDISRDSSHSPIFQTFFSYNPGNNEQLIALPDIKAQLLDADTRTAKFDLSLIISDKHDSLSCHFEYNSNLFLPETIQTMAEHYQQLLQSLCDNPEAAIESLTMLSAEQSRAQLFVPGNYYDFPQQDIASLFEQQVKATPDKTAVVQGRQSLDFGSLNHKANQLAAFMQQQGVAQGDYIGLCFPPSIDLTLAMLATIKLGAVYVPLDPSYPAARLNYMLDNAGIRILLTIDRIQLSGLTTETQIVIDQLDLADYPSHNPERNIELEDALYIIYTSGSTGMPKAAIVNHKGEANLLHWYSRHYQLGGDDRVLVFSAIGFDLTQKNLLAPLCHGAELHFCNTEYYEPQALLDCIEQARISWVNCAPSAFYPLAEMAQPQKLASLKKLFFGGEPIRLTSMQNWLHSGHCHAEIINMYGPTECTDIATSHTIDKPAEYRGVIPIGKPAANACTYVLDKHGNLLPRGAIGELYIGGPGVGKGYLNNPELTAERFVSHPFKHGETLYKTGDLVRFNINDDLEFVSRADDQIKIRGFRIEPGEIEACLRNMENIDDAVVNTQIINGQQQLTAFICSARPLEAVHTYRKTLQKQLPDYMIPLVFCPIDRIPLTPNGKIDRSRLPEIDASCINAGSEYIAPRNDIEEALAVIWQQLLEIERAGIADSFFDLGGNSLMATQLATRIRQHFAIDLPLRTLFEVNTIEGIAEIISAMTGTGINEHDSSEFEEGTL